MEELRLCHKTQSLLTPFTSDNQTQREQFWATERNVIKVDRCWRENFRRRSCKSGKLWLQKFCCTKKELSKQRKKLTVVFIPQAFLLSLKLSPKEGPYCMSHCNYALKFDWELSYSTHISTVWFISLDYKKDFIRSNSNLIWNKIWHSFHPRDFIWIIY